MPQLGSQTLSEVWGAYVNKLETNRRANRVELINYYIGDQEQYLKPYLKLEDNKDDFPYYWTKITKKIINKVSKVYKLPPLRLFGKKEERNDGYEAIIPTKNNRLKVAERQARLLGVIGLRPVVLAEEKIFDYKMIRDFQVLFKKSNTVPHAVRYPVETAANNEGLIYAYWSADQYLILTENNVRVTDKDILERHNIEDDGSNRYNKIPFVWLHSEEIVDDFWNTGGNADDLKMANLHINLMLSEMAHKYRFQSFNPVWVSGVQPDISDIKISYKSALVLEPQEAKVGTLNAEHDFLKDIEAIKFQIQLIERNWNLNINWGIQGNPASGFSLVVQNMDHTDDLEDFTDVAREWERRLLEMERLVGSVDGLRGVPDDTLKVNYNEIRQPISQEEKNKKWEFEFKHKLATKRDYWLSEDPDLTDEQIENRIKALQDEAEQFRTGTPVEQLLNFGGEGE
jgi:hypothetical protein